MAARDFEIQITTSADTSGAEAVSSCLDKVAEQAEEMGGSVEDGAGKAAEALGEMANQSSEGMKEGKAMSDLMRGEWGAAMELATTGMTGLNAAIRANPIGFLAGAVVGLLPLLMPLVGDFFGLGKAAEKVKEETGDAAEKLKETGEAAEATAEKVQTLKEYFDALNGSLQAYETQTTTAITATQELGRAELRLQVAQGKLDADEAKIKEAALTGKGEVAAIDAAIDTQQKMIDAGEGMKADLAAQENAAKAKLGKANANLEDEAKYRAALNPEYKAAFEQGDGLTPRKASADQLKYAEDTSGRIELQRLQGHLTPEEAKGLQKDAAEQIRLAKEQVQLVAILASKYQLVTQAAGQYAAVQKQMEQDEPTAQKQVDDANAKLSALKIQRSAAEINAKAAETEARKAKSEADSKKTREEKLRVIEGEKQVAENDIKRLQNSQLDYKPEDSEYQALAKNIAARQGEVLDYEGAAAKVRGEDTDAKEQGRGLDKLGLEKKAQKDAEDQLREKREKDEKERRERESLVSEARQYAGKGASNEARERLNAAIDKFDQSGNTSDLAVVEKAFDKLAGAMERRHRKDADKVRALEKQLEAFGKKLETIESDRH